MWDDNIKVKIKTTDIFVRGPVRSKITAIRVNEISPTVLALHYSRMKWHQVEVFFSKYFGFSLSFSFHRRSTLIYSFVPAAMWLHQSTALLNNTLSIIYIRLKVRRDAHGIFYVFFIPLYLLYMFRVLLGCCSCSCSSSSSPAATCPNGLSNSQHTITITRTYGYTLQFALLMMGANSTRNIYSKYSGIKNT
jgi:hypothetical protein